MNIEQLGKGLLAKFAQSRIVFWYDSYSEFFREVCILTQDNLALYGTYARDDHPCELPCLRLLHAHISLWQDFRNCWCVSETVVMRKDCN